MVSKTKRRVLDRMLEEREAVRRREAELENMMFKLESVYSELVGGSPITRSIEYYLNNRIEKKKAVADESIRVFATDYPRQKEPSV